jgi:N utilization substance protein A
MKGSRVQAVVQELRGEKIDIVTWDGDPAKFICNALAPAEIVRVVVDEANQSMEVVVPDDQLSLAIGKRGQNVRLASKLTAWKLDVTSETNYNQTLKEGYKSLLELEGVGEKLASDFYEEGFRSAEDLAEATIEDLSSIENMTEEKAQKLIEEAAIYASSEKAESAPEDVSEEDQEEGEEKQKRVEEEQEKGGEEQERVEEEQEKGEEAVDENRVDGET